MRSPSFDACRTTGRTSRITWIIGKTEASLMSDIADIEFVIFDKSRGCRAYQDVRAQLDGRRFDIALCMHASLRANLLCRAIPATMRLGFDKARARDFQWLFTNRRIAAAQRRTCARGDDVVCDGNRRRASRPALGYSAAARRPAFRELSSSQARQPLVVISPCSSQRSRNYRNWSVANYAATIRHLQARHACNVVLTGGNSRLEPRIRDGARD